MRHSLFRFYFILLFVFVVHMVTLLSFTVVGLFHFGLHVNASIKNGNFISYCRHTEVQQVLMKTGAASQHLRTVETVCLAAKGLSFLASLLNVSVYIMTETYKMP
ncbi:hypothetical protein GOODEAATRI_027003 [Goodea atripinnis]|uniref:Uncharacterized protein n=1 Tax=Goodea atripinnis TaxID=208336 RepID=A0ABV0PS19_9TELE